MTRQTSGGKGTKNTPAAPQPKVVPKIVKDSKGNIDPNYGKRIQQEQGVLKPTTTTSKGRGNPLSASKTAEQIRSEQAGKILPKMYAGNAGKDKKKKKKKDLKEDTNNNNNVTLPLPGPPDIGYEPYTFTPTSIKVPDRDAVIALQKEGADQALITSVLFEQIGATELVKFVRNDTVDGFNPQYTVISNISDLKSKLDPSYLIAKQRSDTSIDNGFSIRLQDKMPSIDYLFENNIPNYIHFDPTVGQNGALVIELDNIDVDEIVEVEIDTNGTIVEVRQ